MSGDFENSPDLGKSSETGEIGEYGHAIDMRGSGDNFANTLPCTIGSKSR